MTVINPLMRVPDDEQIIRPFRDEPPQKPPLRRVNVLRLVDDDVVVLRPVHEIGGLIGELRKSRFPFRRQPVRHMPESTPHHGTLRLPERNPAPPPRAREVFLLALEPLREDDLLPLPA